MLLAKQIPDFTGVSVAAASNWWHQMMELGFNINPDDDPKDCVFSESDLPTFDEAACAKVSNIYRRMFECFGERTYMIAQTAYMNNHGYTENQAATSENGQDFWIRASQ